MIFGRDRHRPKISIPDYSRKEKGFMVDGIFVPCTGVWFEADGQDCLIVRIALGKCDIAADTVTQSFLTQGKREELEDMHDDDEAIVAEFERIRKSYQG